MVLGQREVKRCIISFLYHGKSQGKSSFVLFSSLSCGLAFQLAYSYIQCIDVNWPASCSPLIQLSTSESVVSLFAIRRTRLFCSLKFCFIRMLWDLSQHPSQYLRDFIDSQLVSWESLIYVYM
ncbi:hypothetical protein MTR67_016528 [Solanum verrucosum]|uniref:Uncharacterized protein n=1 Tax=Solanum verrucosum TaxID=315347 RepID=A0AAF0QHD9_SOLVR|nr:hypothetical protein MTR67_016528 [Solanum verrucosum]